jgi:hypothetical protein
MFILVRVCIRVQVFSKLEALWALVGALELCSSNCGFVIVLLSLFDDAIDELHPLDWFNDFLIGKWKWIVYVNKQTRKCHLLVEIALMHGKSKCHDHNHTQLPSLMCCWSYHFFIPRNNSYINYVRKPPQLNEHQLARPNWRWCGRSRTIAKDI